MGTLVFCAPGFLVVATDLLIPNASGPAWDGAARLQPEHLFMPFPGEPVASYLARLKAMRSHLELLIAAVERGVATRGPGVVAPAPVAAPSPAAPRRVIPAGAPMAARPARVAPRGGERPSALLPRPAAPATPTALPPRPRLHIVPAPRPAGPGELLVRGPERRDLDADRRGAGTRDRRAGHPDRRRGHPDPRAVKVERRGGPRDRRSGRRERRNTVDRRAQERPDDQPVVVAAAHGMSPVMVFWAVNIICWLAVVIIAFVWGIG